MVAVWKGGTRGLAGVLEVMNHAGADLMTNGPSRFLSFLLPGDVKSNQDDDANVEKVVALLLREAGDKLNQEVRTPPVIPMKLCRNS